jgi:uncharacterized lipoprotein YmbA
MIRILPIILMILVLLGCSSNSPSPKFYTLSSLILPGHAEPPASKGKANVFGIGPVSIPDYLDKPQIVTRAPANELLLSEFNLWGGSLKTDVHRVLIENISLLLASEPVTVVGWKTYVPGAYRIPVYLLRFDAVPDGSLFLEAKWGIVAQDGRPVVAIRESSITKPVRGKEYSDIISAMSDALADLSKEIASAIKGVARNS